MEPVTINKILEQKGKDWQEGCDAIAKLIELNYNELTGTFDDFIDDDVTADEEFMTEFNELRVMRRKLFELQDMCEVVRNKYKNCCSDKQ